MHVHGPGRQPREWCGLDAARVGPAGPPLDGELADLRGDELEPSRVEGLAQWQRDLRPVEAGEGVGDARTGLGDADIDGSSLAAEAGFGAEVAGSDFRP